MEINSNFQSLSQRYERSFSQFERKENSITPTHFLLFNHLETSSDNPIVGVFVASVRCLAVFAAAIIRGGDKFTGRDVFDITF